MDSKMDWIYSQDEFGVETWQLVYSDEVLVEVEGFDGDIQVWSVFDEVINAGGNFDNFQEAKQYVMSKLSDFCKAFLEFAKNA